MNLGDLVEGGVPQTDGYDRGHILEVAGDMVLVGWSCGERTRAEKTELQVLEASPDGSLIGDPLIGWEIV